MLNDDQKEYLKSILECAQYSCTTYKKERTEEFLEGYKRSLETAKEIFEDCLDIGYDDPWFMER